MNMGWTGGKESRAVLDRWQVACFAASGQSNVWEVAGVWYSFDVSRTEHADGAITGSMSRFDKDPRGPGPVTAVRCGTFRVEGDGRVTRGPKILRLAAGPR